MTLREPTPPEAVLVAIDVSKNRNDVLIEVPGRRRRRRLVIEAFALFVPGWQLQALLAPEPLDLLVV